MNDDKAIRRAAGVIMWYLERGGTAADALARAQEREPELSDSEIGQAYEWAIAALRFVELYETADPDESVDSIMRRAGLPGV